MKDRKVSLRDALLAGVLAMLLCSVLYYTLFYLPLQREFLSLSLQSAQLDADLQLAAAKQDKMAAMQAELQEIFSLPAEERREIPPYDNAKAVMSELDGILQASDTYELLFRAPETDREGTVRRVVELSFQCRSYANAKKILLELADNRWCCLVNALSVASVPPKGRPADLMSTPVKGTVTLTFLERIEPTGTE